MKLTPAAVRKQIKAGSPAPIYLLQGEDDVEKSALATDFEELVDEGLRAFNFERIHAADATTGERVAAAVGNVISAARTLPMMSPRRVVAVLQADALLAPRRESEAAARALEQLETYIKQPEPQTVLVLVARAIDKRSRLYKLLAKEATLVDCGVLETVADAERWVKNRVAAAGAAIDAGAVRRLAEQCGPDVKRLRNDVERLLLYALGQNSITSDDVREISGPAALQDDWAMTNAIEAGDGAAALRQLALMLDAGAPAEKVLGQLAWAVRTRFGPRTLPPAVDALFRTDLDLKRSAGDPRVLLERLVAELCAGRAMARPGGVRDDRHEVQR